MEDLTKNKKDYTKAIKEYKLTCNKIANLFSEKQDLEFDGWVADDIGGIASFVCQYFFNMGDMVLDLSTNQEAGFILDWQNDGVEAHFKNENTNNINYRSYIMGLRYK